MLPESSPFTPGQPVPVEFFIGRTAEIQHLLSLVKGSTAGRFKIGFVTGERGIGKSSLVSFVRHLCERDESVAAAHVFLGGANGLQDMARRVFDRIIKDSVEKPWFERMKSFFGNHVQKVGLFGATVELKLNQDEIATLVNSFVPTLRKLLSDLKNERKALFLILDDINGLADSAEFANWLKSTVDEIATDNIPFPVSILIVGLEERRQRLIELQPSLARVFDLIDIKPWSNDETSEFYAKTFQKTAAIAVDPSALRAMVNFTGGFPLIAQEIGDSVWRTAGNGKITAPDARIGIINAAEIIGRKFIEPQILQAIRSKEYRTILSKLVGENFFLRFKRADHVKDLTKQQQKAFDNFLSRMKELGAIIPEPTQGPGCYRFQSPMHHLYFCMQSRAQAEENP